MRKKLFVLLMACMIVGLVVNIATASQEGRDTTPTPTMENMKKYVVGSDVGFYAGTYVAVLVARKGTTVGKGKDLATVFINATRDKAIREDGAKAFLYSYRMYVLRENKTLLVSGHVDPYTLHYIWIF